MTFLPKENFIWVPVWWNTCVNFKISDYLTLLRRIYTIWSLKRLFTITHILHFYFSDKFLWINYIPATPSQGILNLNITFLHMNSPEQCSSLHKNCFYIIYYWFTFLVMSPLPLLVSLMVMYWAGKQCSSTHKSKSSSNDNSHVR